MGNHLNCNLILLLIYWNVYLYILSNIYTGHKSILLFSVSLKAARQHQRLCMSVLRLPLSIVMRHEATRAHPHGRKALPLPILSENIFVHRGSEQTRVHSHRRKTLQVFVLSKNFYPDLQQEGAHVATLR